METREGRVFTICENHWLFACLAHGKSLWDGRHGFNLNPEVGVGKPRTESQRAGWQGIVVG